MVKCLRMQFSPFHVVTCRRKCARRTLRRSARSLSGSRPSTRPSESATNPPRRSDLIFKSTTHDKAAIFWSCDKRRLLVREESQSNSNGFDKKIKNFPRIMYTLMGLEDEKFRRRKSVETVPLMGRCHKIFEGTFAGLLNLHFWTKYFIFFMPNVYFLQLRNYELIDWSYKKTFIDFIRQQVLETVF